MARDEDARAAQLAAEQRVRQEHDRKVAWVLLRMDDERGLAHRQVFFESWRDLIEDAKLAANMSNVTAQAERYRRMHRAD